MSADHIESLLSQMRPGMHLCTSDYKAWGDLEAIERPDGLSPVLTGRARATGAQVAVPVSAVLEIRADRCVCLDAPMATIDDQGWERPGPRT